MLAPKGVTCGITCGDAKLRQPAWTDKFNLVAKAVVEKRETQFCAAIPGKLFHAGIQAA